MTTPREEGREERVHCCKCGAIPPGVGVSSAYCPQSDHVWVGGFVAAPTPPAPAPEQREAVEGEWEPYEVARKLTMKIDVYYEHEGVRREHQHEISEALHQAESRGYSLGDSHGYERGKVSRDVHQIRLVIGLRATLQTDGALLREIIDLGHLSPDLRKRISGHLACFHDTPQGEGK